MAVLRTKRALVLAKVQTVLGTDSVPDAANDAIRVLEGATFVVNPEVNDSGEFNGSLDEGEPEVTAQDVTVTCPVHIKGSGTAGTAPECGVLLRGCSMSETVAAGVSVTYAPISEGDEALSIYYFLDGVLFRAIDCKGTFSLSYTAKQKWQGTFTFQGTLLDMTDAPVPNNPVYQTTTAPNWKDSKAHIDTVPAAVQQFTLDYGLTQATLDDPNDLQGNLEIINSTRNITGQINPAMELVATRDLFGNMVAETKHALLMEVGKTPGNITALNVPQAKWLGYTPADDQGGVRTDIPFDAVGVNTGIDLVFT